MVDDVELEHLLAAFHGRYAATIFSSAFATIIGVLPPLITEDTIVLSDEFNHNCFTTPVGKCGDRAAANCPLTMHQTGSPITLFGHRININAIRLADPGEKAIFRHLAVDELEQQLQKAAGDEAIRFQVSADHTTGDIDA